MTRTDNFQKHLDGECSCPLCGEPTHVEGKSVDIIKNTAEQEVVCQVCGGSWTDIYVLTDIKAVQDGDTGDP